MSKKKIDQKGTSVQQFSTGPQAQVNELITSLRESLAVRAAELLEHLSQAEQLLSALLAKDGALGPSPFSDPSSSLCEKIIEILNTSVRPSPEEVTELTVLSLPPGHSRPLWHPKRWLAEAYKFVWGRQYDFNVKLRDHLVRLACHTEALRTAFLQTAKITISQTQRILEFERAGYDLLRELVSKLEISFETLLRPELSIKSSSLEVLPPIHKAKKSSIIKETEATTSEVAILRESIDKLCTHIARLEEKFVQLSVLGESSTFLANRLEKQTSSLASQLTELREEISRLRGFTTTELFPTSLKSRTSLPTLSDRAVPYLGKPLSPAFSFLEFERALRGGEYQIAQEQSRYVEWFVSQSAPILDVGCGRGEFLELLRQHGIEAMGIDRDADMVSYCQQKGLRVMQAELEDYLKSLPDESLGGVFLGQVIEHLEQRLVLELPTLLWNKLVPGGTVVIETVNPMCLSTFAGAMYADPTHVRPIHPKGLEFLLASVGFVDMTLLFSAPVPEADKLQLIQEKAPLEPTTKDIVIQMNENFQRLNTLLYSYANYALAARKPQ